MVIRPRLLSWYHPTSGVRESCAAVNPCSLCARGLSTVTYQRAGTEGDPDFIRSAFVGEGIQHFLQAIVHRLGLTDVAGRAAMDKTVMRFAVVLLTAFKGGVIRQLVERGADHAGRGMGYTASTNFAT